MSKKLGMKNKSYTNASSEMKKTLFLSLDKQSNVHVMVKGKTSLFFTYRDSCPLFANLVTSRFVLLTIIPVIVVFLLREVIHWVGGPAYTHTKAYFS